jgi:tight adherence protein C
MKPSLLILLAFLFSLIFYFLIEEESGTGDNLLQKRLSKLYTPTPENVRFSSMQKTLNIMNKMMMPIIKLVSDKINMKALKQLLTEAGKSATNDEIFKFIGLKIILAIVGFAMALSIVFLGIDPKLRMILLAVFPISSYILPDFKIKKEIKTRQEDILYNLPDALDLLTVCVEAGLGLDAALIRVSQEQYRTAPVLSREFEMTSKKIMSGISRQEAFKTLANRNNVPDLKSFVALLIQTDKLGTSIGQSLRVYSDTIRAKRRQRAEELAAKASVKMVIPLVLFVLPSMFVVLLAPAVMKLVENLKTIQ